MMMHFSSYVSLRSLVASLFTSLTVLQKPLKSQICSAAQKCTFCMWILGVSLIESLAGQILDSCRNPDRLLTGPACKRRLSPQCKQMVRSHFSSRAVSSKLTCVSVPLPPSESPLLPEPLSCVKLLPRWDRTSSTGPRVCVVTGQTCRAALLVYLENVFFFSFFLNKVKTFCNEPHVGVQLFISLADRLQPLAPIQVEVNSRSSMYHIMWRVALWFGSLMNVCRKLRVFTRLFDVVCQAVFS